jgi:hypothetical protein
MLRLVALVRADVSEEVSASFIRATRIGELGTMLALTKNRRKTRKMSISLSVAEVEAWNEKRSYFLCPFHILVLLLIVKNETLAFESQSYFHQIIFHRINCEEECNN